MPIVSRIIFGMVRWASRKGLREERESVDDDASEKLVEDAEELENEMRMAARREGIRGETYAYWYLRCEGYVFIARNFSPRATKGEIEFDRV